MRLGKKEGENIQMRKTPSFPRARLAIPPHSIIMDGMKLRFYFLLLIFLLFLPTGIEE